MKKNKEFIICSAIWYQDLPTQRLLPKNIIKGTVILGYRHMQCIDLLKHLTNLRSVQKAIDGVGNYEQGFITNLNRFVDRNEAWIIAKNANQIINDNPIKNILFSEDLW